MNRPVYTLKDIAELAQVSRGTVDRVVHGRGKVSKKTYSKVKLILDKIDYKPNLVAQTLRKGVLYEIAVLMPDYQYEIYWKRAFEGVNKAITDYASFGITIQTFLFNPYESLNFKQQYEKIVSGKFSAVLVAPIFYKESLVFFSKCRDAGLPYFTFNTYLEDSGAITHIGVDLFQNGKTAGSLMHKVLSGDDEYLVMHINEELKNSRHMQEKEQGFNQYLVNKGVVADQIHVLTVDGIEKIEGQLMQKLSDVDKIKGIFVTTSKVWMVAKILHTHALDKVLIGSDLLEENVHYLNTGIIDFLIFQNPLLQANLGIQSIIDHLVFKNKIHDRILLPIEIIIKENLREFQA
ncbi:MAG: substrate-binding domain-containing protein [Bacteroidota bacterium]